MNIDVLALKYRPKFFSEVRGQELVIKTLSNSIELEKLHNSYLFSGTRGMGKTTIARLFAKSLLCQTSVTSQPCGKCSTCMEIDQGNNFKEILIEIFYLLSLNNCVKMNLINKKMRTFYPTIRSCFSLFLFFNTNNI